MKREEWIFVEQNDRPRLKLVKECTPVHVLPPCSLLLDIHVAILIAFDMLALEGATLNIDTTGAGRKNIGGSTYFRRSKATHAHHSHHGGVVIIGHVHLLPFLSTIYEGFSILSRPRG